MQPILSHATGEKAIIAKLIAPETVRELLEKFPTTLEGPIENEIEQAVFMRRIRKDILELLSTEGYFTGQVNLQSVSPQGVPFVEVVPGVRTVVANVDIEFRGDLAQSDQLHKARVQQLIADWPLKANMPFRSSAWEDAKAGLLAQVMSQDYAFARMIVNSVEVDASSGRASIRIVVDSGPRYIFGELNVIGLERYERLLVTRYATFSPGQPYRRDLLLSFQTQLQNLPQFASVIVNLDTTSQSTQSGTDQVDITVPVKVQIVEAQSRKISVGIGYSTNNGVRNELNYLSYNFLNQAWTLSSAFIVEQNRQIISVGLDTPPNPLGYHLAWKGSGEKTQIQGLDTLRDKFGVTRSRTLFKIETGIGLNWQQERRIPQGGIRETDQVLALGWFWILRNVNNPLFPVSGFLSEFRLDGASKEMLSDQDFVRSYMRNQLWIPLNEHNVLTLRIEGGYTASTTRLGIPQEYLFRIGGTQTVRGFAYQSLGFHEGDAIVGGRVMATGSAEFTHWFGNWGIAAFGDAGGAADVVPELRMSQGYGFGARWRSPVGPLALDMARGKGEPDSRIHFSIAVAF